MTCQKKTPSSDPFAAREAKKYLSPVPSREFILDYLSSSVGPLTHGQICTDLDLSNADQIEGMRPVSYTHLTLPTSDLV